MSIVPGGPLLLLTWVGWSLSLMGIGLAMLPVITRGRGRHGGLGHLAAAGWLGLSLVTLAALAVNLVAGLGWPVAQVGAWVVLVGGWALLLLWWRGRRPRLRWSGSRLAVIVALVIGVVLASLWAAGPATNYDTGLYHAQSIWYARDSAVVPGLANLHDRLGFNSSMWPLSAFFSLGLWTGSEFRLVNGVLLTLLVLDVGIRLARPRVRSSPGTLLLLAGAFLAMAVIAQYPGRLIASSAQDTAALLLTFTALAALLDAALPRPDLSDTSRESIPRSPTARWRASPRASSAIAVVLAVQCAVMRPVGWVFAGGVVLATVLLLWRRLGVRAAIRALVPSWIIAFTALVLMLARDAVLSGWLLFPLSAFPMPVVWRTLDPTSAARDITGWARTPFQDVDVTLANGDWVAGWLRRLPTDWSIPVLMSLLLILILIIAISQPSRRALRSCWRGLLAVEAPVIAALCVWFVNAPDPRFAWGYLVGVVLIPVVTVIASLGLVPLWQWAWSAIYGLLLILALARGSFSAMSWEVVSLPTPQTRAERMIDGTVIRVPVAGDQCWSVYPLCAPDYAGRAIELDGASVFSGIYPAGRPQT